MSAREAGNGAPRLFLVDGTAVAYLRNDLFDSQQRGTARGINAHERDQRTQSQN